MNVTIVVFCYADSNFGLLSLETFSIKIKNVNMEEIIFNIFIS